MDLKSRPHGVRKVDHVITACRLEREDRDLSPFDANGGLGRMHKLLGESMDALIEELNKELTA